MCAKLEDCHVHRAVSFLLRQRVMALMHTPVINVLLLTTRTKYMLMSASAARLVLTNQRWPSPVAKAANLASTLILTCQYLANLAPPLRTHALWVASQSLHLVRNTPATASVKPAVWALSATKPPQLAQLARKEVIRTLRVLRHANRVSVVGMKVQKVLLAAQSAQCTLTQMRKERSQKLSVFHRTVSLDILS